MDELLKKGSWKSPFKKFNKDYFFKAKAGFMGESQYAEKEHTEVLEEYWAATTYENGDALFIKNQEQRFIHHIKDKKTAEAHEIYEMVKIDINNTPALDETICIKDWDYLAKLILLPEIDVNKITEKEPLLQYILSHKESDIARYFNQKTDFFSHADFQEAFDFAIATRDVSLASELLKGDNGVAYRKKVMATLHEILPRFREMINFLGESIKSVPEYPFFEAIYNGDVKKVTEFLDNGMSPNAKLSKMHTALLYAIASINATFTEKSFPLIMRGIFISISPFWTEAPMREKNTRQ